LLQPSYTFNFCRKSLKFSEIEVKISGKFIVIYYIGKFGLTLNFTGKWFNYGIIVFVMMLDLNMWKNQIIYSPADFGQYTHPGTHQVYTVNETAWPTKFDLEDPELSNYTIWTWELRSQKLHPLTNKSLVESDLVINSLYIGYHWSIKALSFIPIFCGELGDREVNCCFVHIYFF